MCSWRVRIQMARIQGQYAREPAEGRKGRTVLAPARIMQVCLPVIQETALHVFRLARYFHHFIHIVYTYIVSPEAASVRERLLHGPFNSACLDTRSCLCFTRPYMCIF